MEYVIRGMWPIEGLPKAYLDSESLQIKNFQVERIGYFEQPINRDRIDCHKVTIIVELPDDISVYQNLKVTSTIRGEEILWKSIIVSELNSDVAHNNQINDNKVSYVRVLLRKVKRRLNRYLSKFRKITEKRTTKCNDERMKSDYELWCEKAHLTDAQVEAQSKYDAVDMPLLSVFVTNKNEYLSLESELQKQTYKKWEIINDNKLDDAQGDFIVFWNGIDRLSKDALFEIAQMIHSDDNVDLIYGDDEITGGNKRVFENTRFKPDYNLELLRSQNYIGDFFAVKKTLVRSVGEIDQSLNEWKSYDYLLRCVEITEYVRHISRILSFFIESNEKNYNEGANVLRRHYARRNLPVDVKVDKETNCFYARYHWEKEPLLSIIIPNKDHVDDLRRCIESIENKSSYKNVEIVIVENNSEEIETFSYYEELEEKNPNVKVLKWEKGFNYSAINNFGARYANGEYLLLLNNDTEFINTDCLEVMLQYCMREDVGAVGARLYYDDNTIQHAGVIIGLGGIAGHAFTHMDKSSVGYMKRTVCTQEYSALTAACLMVKRDAYEKVGGLTEELVVAFNDIDFCLKLREAGYKVIYNPLAELYHYESKSRGAEDTPEKVARFHNEIRYIESRWSDILLWGDPNYNKNLTIDKDAFTIKKW